MPFWVTCSLLYHQEINEAGRHCLLSATICVRGGNSHCIHLPEALGHSWLFFFFRTINLKNPVLQQVLERRNEVLCVLIQKIVTTQKCVISEHVQIEEKCGGMVGIQTKTVQVCKARGWWDQGRGSRLGPSHGDHGQGPLWVETELVSSRKYNSGEQESVCLCSCHVCANPASVTAGSRT